MNRIVLLLAAVGLGSGCVVNTCDPRSLTVDWSFVDASGVSGLACGDTGLTQPIHDVDIYVDGSPVATYVPCLDYGATIVDLGSGGHDVIVEGYDAAGYVITRDLFTVNVASCGDTSVLAQPGEGYAEILPNTCEASTTYLTFSLADVTRTPSFVAWEVTPATGGITSYTCQGGVTVPVPLGYYDLNGIEEVDATATTIYGSKCTTTPIDVLTYGTTSTAIDWTGTAACF